MTAQIVFINILTWSILGIFVGLLATKLASIDEEDTRVNDVLIGVLGGLLGGVSASLLFNLTILSMTGNLLALTGAFLLLIFSRVVLVNRKIENILQDPKLSSQSEVYYSQISPHPNTIQKYLAEVSYPISKRDLLRLAEQEGASRQSLNLFEKLPDHIYENPVEINRALIQTIV